MRSFIGVCLAVAFAGFAQAQPAAPNPFAGVVAPRSVERPNCGSKFYPAASQAAHEEGRVVMKMMIGTDGLPHDVAVVQSSGFPRLDAAAVACVQTWRYTPATKDGQPIEIPANPTVVWKIF